MESLTFYFSQSTDFTIWLALTRLQMMQKSTVSPVCTFFLSALPRSETGWLPAVHKGSGQPAHTAPTPLPHAAAAPDAVDRGMQPAGALMTTPTIFTKFPPDDAALPSPSGTAVP